MHRFEIPHDKIILAGDWHRNSRHAGHVIKKAGELGIKLILQLGDFGYLMGSTGAGYLKQLNKMCEKHNVELWFLDGNHESYDILLQYAGYSDDPDWVMLTEHIFWIRRGTRWHWNNKEWLVMGGATSLDREWRTEGYDVFSDEEEISDEDIHMAIAGGKADVMLTHDCPSSVIHAYPDYGLPAAEKLRAENHSLKLQRIVDGVQPEQLIHGHLHILYQRTIFMPYGECVVTGLGMDGDDTNWFVFDTKTLEFLPHEGVEE